MATELLEIRRPDDMHVHLRDGQALAGYAADAARFFARVLVMPNTTPPIVTARDVIDYRARVVEAAPGLDALMTFKIAAAIAPRSIPELAAAGAIAGKLYPRGATTNSEDGVADVESAFPLFEAMEAEGLALCIHGEDPTAAPLERERAFLPVLARIVERFPRLKVVFEHVSSKEGVEAIERMPATVAATVTVHHLLYTLDDLFGGRLNPHLFCKPLIKGAADRAAIQRVVLDGDRRFFFGSDSAPHPRAAKEGGSGAAGVYSMPVSLSLLAGFFADHGVPEKMEDFVSLFGARFYGLPLNEGRLVMRRRILRVPAEVHGVVPLAAGKELPWSADAMQEDR